jgi:formate dehydrogenase major subunit
MGLGKLLKTYVGLVPNPVSDRTRQTQARVRGAKGDVSVCPYCAVGCSQLVYSKEGRIIDIEGNEASPINGGTLCPKGAATFGLMTSPLRLTRIKYRAPHADHWEERTLDWCLDRIAQLVKQTRDASFQETDQHGRPVNRTLAIGHLGGATLDNEENYLIKKLFTAGLGIVAVENQARI